MSGSGAPLDEGRLRELLGAESFVTRLVLRDCVGSTNDLLRDLAAQGAAEGTVVLAEGQTAGRGRRGRCWHSPRGMGLFLSVLFRPKLPAPELTRWTLGAAVAACESCRRATGSDVGIAWPNDLIWGGRKLGGVLTEVRTAGGAATDLVIGTGLNVSQAIEDFPHELSSLATSLRVAASGVAPEREKVAALYLLELGGIARALQSGGWSRVARRWERLAPGARGQRVRVIRGQGDGEQSEGVTTGLDELGALRVRHPNGQIVSVRMAESVLPLEA